MLEPLRERLITLRSTAERSVRVRESRPGGLIRRTTGDGEFVRELRTKRLRDGLAIPIFVFFARNILTSQRETTGFRKEIPMTSISHTHQLGKEVPSHSL